MDPIVSLAIGVFAGVVVYAVSSVSNVYPSFVEKK